MYGDLGTHLSISPSRASVGSSTTLGSDDDERWFVKMLLSDGHLTSLIESIDGMGSILDLISIARNVSLTVSSPGCYFPGTADRVVLISGSKGNVVDAHVDLLRSMETILLNTVSIVTGTAQVLVAKIVVPNSTVSSIIGLGGCRIKSIQESTGCFVHVGKRKSEVLERFVEIGSALHEFDNLISATLQVISYVQLDPNFAKHLFVNYSSDPKHQTRHTSLDIEMLKSGLEWESVTQAPTHIDLILATEAIGAVVERGGSHLDKIVRLSGANIQIEKCFSARRKVSISGTFESVQAAHFLIVATLQAKGVPLM